MVILKKVQKRLYDLIKNNIDPSWVNSVETLEN